MASDPRLTGLASFTPPWRWWKWIVGTVLVLIAGLGVAFSVLIHRAGPILKSRVEETLSTKFGGKVELGALSTSFFRGLEGTGSDLKIYPPPEEVAAGASVPLISIANFEFHSGVIGLLFQPMRVSEVHVSGMEINIPPRELRRGTGAGARRKGRLHFALNKMICDRSLLMIGTNKPDKDPKRFELDHIELHEVGPDTPWNFEAVLVNAIPRGDIYASGTFGPWQTDKEGDTPLTGTYKFQHADLNTIKGIGGVLSSRGRFSGQLDRIVVDGTTDTPDFSLDTANHKLPLHTEFHAVVDGTTGDTYLQPVRAKLGSSSCVTTGAVVNRKGQGHQVDLDVDIPEAQISDFLELTVRTQPAVMTGKISAQAKLQIRPGKESIAQKLGMEGRFSLQHVHFTNPQLQDKVDMLSLRAQGEPKSAKPGATDVNSSLRGVFEMSTAVLRFRDLLYTLPGGEVNLTGTYSMDGQQFDFHGVVLTDVSLSRMVDSPWKSLLLRVVSPWFKRKGGGAEIPVSISGTKSEPKLGLDVRRRPQNDEHH